MILFDKVNKLPLYQSGFFFWDMGFTPSGGLAMISVYVTLIGNDVIRIINNNRRAWIDNCYCWLLNTFVDFNSLQVWLVGYTVIWLLLLNLRVMAFSYYIFSFTEELIWEMLLIFGQLYIWNNKYKSWNYFKIIPTGRINRLLMSWGQKEQQKFNLNLKYVPSFTS